MKKALLGTKMKQESSMTDWSNAVMNLPLIATVLVKNNQDTVYSCLLKSSKLFDAIIVVLDGSNDGSLLEIDRFIRRENVKHVHIFDLSSHNPWPQFEENDEFVNYARSQEKCFSLAKSLEQTGIWVSLCADVLLDDHSRDVIVDRVRQWAHPEFNHEIFSTNDQSVENTQLDHKSGLVIAAWLKSILWIGPETYKSGLSLYLRQHDKILMTMIDKNQKLQKIGNRISQRGAI